MSECRYPLLGTKRLQKNKSGLRRPIEKNPPKSLLENRSPTGSHSGTTAQTASTSEMAAPEPPRLGVLLEREHDLGGAIPPRRDVFGHEPCLGARELGGLDVPRQPEITRFEIAVSVEEEVRGFEIAIDDVGRVESFEHTEGLVYKALRVVVGEASCVRMTWCMSVSISSWITVNTTG